MSLFINHQSNSLRYVRILHV